MFEDFTDIKIPKSARVIKDEYQDMIQDYGKVLELKMNKNSADEIESSIIKSNFYNADIYSDKGILENQEKFLNNKKGLWYRTKNGYTFSGSTNNNRDNVSANIDTIKMSATFQYLSD